MTLKTEIDVIIVSYAQNEDLKQITKNAIRSLICSEDPEVIQFNVIVVESQKSLFPYQYPKSKTVYPDVPFGYHRYLNIGIGMGSADFVCLCNNDLLFHKNWATEILKPFNQFTDVYSASPICSRYHLKNGYNLFDGPKVGYRIREEIAGWCLFLKRDVLKITGKLDENYTFWFADNDYANTLYVFNMPHILVTSSVVDHLESKTLNEQTEERKEELTQKDLKYLENKWNPRFGTGWEIMD